MMEYFTEALVFLGLALAAVTGYFRLQQEKLAKDIAERELHIQTEALDFADIVDRWGSTEEEVKQLLKETPIDRFIIFRAWNGILTPKWTTAIFQLRQEGQKLYSYVHVKVDNDYVNKLRETIEKGICYYKVSNLEDSLIKDIYEAEGVKSAIWTHIISKESSDKRTKALTYCSFASHVEEDLDVETITRCRIIANRLTGIALGLSNAK